MYEPMYDVVADNALLLVAALGLVVVAGIAVAVFVWGVGRLLRFLRTLQNIRRG